MAYEPVLEDPACRWEYRMSSYEALLVLGQPTWFMSVV
jgi:hypothetical protein